MNRGADFVQPLVCRLWRQNKELDRTLHTAQSNYRLLARRTAPVSTAIVLKITQLVWRLKMTIFRRSGHWRTNNNGNTFWISDHNVSREDWDRNYTGRSLEIINNVQFGVAIKNNRLEYASFVNPNAKCPICGEPVFYYESPYGGKVYFDSLGPPWPKHPCFDSPISKKCLISHKHQNKWQEESWLPFQTKVIDVYENSILKISGLQLDNKKLNFPGWFNTLNMHRHIPIIVFWFECT
jgi:hypothetical protein